MMIFRATTMTDIPQIITIFDQAKVRLKAQHIDQWQNGYPNAENILADITLGTAYVLCASNQTVLATTAFSFAGEPTYDVIYDGKWLNDAPYAVIHRIATRTDYVGKQIATKMLWHCEQLCLARQVNNLRVDTHKDNKIMQHFLVKNGFKQCGIILLTDGAERLAYQKIVRG